MSNIKEEAKKELISFLEGFRGEPNSVSNRRKITEGILKWSEKWTIKIHSHNLFDW